MQPFYQHILHPTDLSEASRVAFDHALAIALTSKSSFTIMNARKGFTGDDWSRFPGVRETLTRWGLLEESSGRADVLRKLSVHVRRIGVDARDPTDVILDHLAEHATELVVMATEAREGLPRLLKGSVSEKVTRIGGAQVLLVPARCRGFVSHEDGSLSLTRILVPVAETPDPDEAATVATRTAQALANRPVELHAVHVGDHMPDVDLADGGNWTWHTTTRSGDVVEGILSTARDVSADLIVMTTDGPDGFRDLFRGSHVNRVVRGAPCPVIAIPVNQDA